MIDNEKASEPFGRDRKYKGVAISSRYEKVGDIRSMMAMVDSWPPLVQSLVKSIFCDTKASATYTIEMMPVTAELAYLTLHSASDALLKLDGGYNGVYLNSGAHEFISDANWGDLSP